MLEEMLTQNCKLVKSDLKYWNDLWALQLSIVDSSNYETWKDLTCQSILKFSCWLTPRQWMSSNYLWCLDIQDGYPSEDTWLEMVTQDGCSPEYTFYLLLRKFFKTSSLINLSAAWTWLEGSSPSAIDRKRQDSFVSTSCSNAPASSTQCNMS
jgi:hypothetical protein